MRWFNQTGDDSGVGSGVLLPEFQTPTTTPAAPTTSSPSGGGANLDTLTQLLQTGVDIGKQVREQRQASGAAASRQARLAACGRRPLFPGAKRDAYDKCVAQAMGGSGGYTPPPPPSSSSKSNTMLYVGLGVVALGIVGFIIYRRNK